MGHRAEKGKDCALGKSEVSHLPQQGDGELFGGEACEFTGF